MTPKASNGRVVGVRGASWRGTVTPHGSLVSDDASAELSWHVAADDRWYSPAQEPSLRQKWYGGYPVCETRIRIPSGDLVQRVYAVADLGGMTVMEFENESTLPIVIAVTRPDVFTMREPIDNPPMGIDLPKDSITIPVGHKSIARIALAHVNPSSGRLPDDIAQYQSLVRGWETACDVASRINVPDHTVVATISAVRSNLLLGETYADDAEAIELVRLGEVHRDSIIGVVEAVQRRLKREKRSKVLAWDTPHFMSTAARACVLLGDDVAVGDIGAAWLRMADRAVQELPIAMPEGLGAIAWTESLLAFGSPSGGHCDVLPHGIPETWWGSSFEAHRLIADPYRLVSYAVRWHGARPALLWEIDGPPGLVLSSSGADPEWHSTDATGETLLAAPSASRRPFHSG